MITDESTSRHATFPFCVEIPARATFQANSETPLGRAYSALFPQTPQLNLDCFSRFIAALAKFESNYSRVDQVEFAEDSL